MSFTVNTSLQVPERIQLGLINGSMERIGGVVREKGSQKIVAFLRESGAVPTSSRMLGEALPQQLSQALHLNMPVPSLVTLGATVAFGAAALYKLNKIDKKLDRIGEKLDIVESKIDELNAKVDRLSWSVDVGFASTLRALGVLERSLENEIKAQLTSAAQAAWSCQFLSPESPQRMMRIEQARSIASVATERLVQTAMDKLTFTKMLLQARGEGTAMLHAGEKYPLEFLAHVRKAVIAIDLNAKIMAESGDTYAAAAIINEQYEKLRGALLSIGRAYLGVDNGEGVRSLAIYGDLMNSAYADVMPTGRLDAWVMRFDPEMGGALGVYDRLRRENRLSSSPNEDWEGYWSSEEHRTKAISFAGQLFDLLDTCWEGVDRLGGHAHEFSVAAKYFSSWQEYRDTVALRDIPEESPLVFMLPSEELQVT